jgi:uncharacterized protein
MRSDEVVRSLSNNILHLILMPTEACNFRCVYCYEHFQYKRMEPRVVAGVRNLLSHRAPSLDSLTISWFGGEPLLARDIMEDVLLHARSLQGANPSLRFRSDVTSNGYFLSRDVFERFRELGIASYQISFDGPKAWHDRKRVLAGGKGTYDRIWQNLTMLREIPGDFHILVRLHADRENAHALPTFMDEYEQTFGSDPRFELFVRTLSRLGGPNDSVLPVFGADEGRKAVEALRQRARASRLKQREFTPGEAVCYAARGNSFLIRANGRINKCTVALEHPNNQVGRLLEDGTVELDVPRMGMWMRGLLSGDSQELQCPMLGYAEPAPNLVPYTDARLSPGRAESLTGT